MTKKAVRRRFVVKAFETLFGMAVVAAAILGPMWAVGYLLHILGY